MTPRGINQREADVAQSFTRVVDKIIERAPEIVLVGGDVFHQVHPPNSAIVHAFKQFYRMRSALPGTKIVMVAGNHDMPRTTETGSILKLFTSLGIDVVDAEPRMLDVPELDLSVLAIAHSHHARPLMKPSGARKWNVLVTHAEAVGEYDDLIRPPELAAREIPAEDFHADEWDYIALGHYHVYKQLDANRFYSGATDYTSSNVWSEKAEEKEKGIKGKRIIEWDLTAGTHIWHDIPSSRSFIDLPQISARGLTASEVNEQIIGAVDRVKGGIDDKIVRIVVRDLPRHVERELDHRQLREFRKRALYFQIDAHRPDVVKTSAHGAPGRTATLEELVRDKLRERILPPDVDRDALVELGVQYLREATLREGQMTGIALVSDS
jgi:DNA repair exonuclease SbcCD nuclease subunit